MTRLLVLTPEFDSPSGGIGTFYREILPVLVAEGAEVRVVVGSAFHSADDANRRTWQGVAVETLERRRIASAFDGLGQYAGANDLRRHLAAAVALWSQAQTGPSFDVVEACDYGLSFLPPVVTGDHPVVVQCHGSLGQLWPFSGQSEPRFGSILTRALEAAGLRRAAAVQAYSAANAAYWSRETGRAVDLIRPALTATAGGGDATISGHGMVVGRLQNWKGPDVLCEALEVLGARAPVIDWFGGEVTWGRAGVGAKVWLSKRFPRTFGDRLVHHDPIPADEVRRRQAAALFHVVPSTWDVFNLGAAEAMASGRPTIVSSGAGASELIENGVDGFVFAAGDAEGLAEVIARILSLTPKERATIGEAGRAKVSSRMDPGTVARHRLAAYSAARRSIASPDAWLDETIKMSGDSDEVFLRQFAVRRLLRHGLARAKERYLG